MKPQKPAKGILLTNEWPAAKAFHIECDCTATDHSVQMWIEVQRDKDIPDVELSFYVTTWTPVWEAWGQRLKAIYEIIFKGVHKQEHHMLLNKQAAINLSSCITEVVREFNNEK